MASNNLRLGSSGVAVGLLVTAALTIRIVLVVGVLASGAGPDAFHAPDTDSYLRDAQELLSTGTFGPPGDPDIVRTPGYPLLLLPGVSAGSPEVVTIVLQILLSGLTVLLVYDLGRLLAGDRRIALLAAGLYAVEPLSILYTSLLLTETLFTFLIVGALDLLVRFQLSSRWRDAVWAAVALAASAYVRPVSYFLPLWLGGLLLVMALRPGPQRKRRLAQVILFGATAMLLVGAWQLRNVAVAGFPGFSAIEDINLYFYNGASVLAAEKGLPYYRVQEQIGYLDRELYLEQHPEQVGWSDAERYRSMGRAGLRILRSHPGEYAFIHLEGVLRTLMDPGAVDYLRLLRLYPVQGGLLGEAVDKGILATVMGLAQKRPLAFWSTAALGILLGAYYLLALVGLVSRRFFLSATALLLAAAIYFVLISGGPASLSRFRHPVMPIVCLFAAAGIVEMSRERSAVRTRPRDGRPRCERSAQPTLRRWPGDFCRLALAAGPLRSLAFRLAKGRGTKPTKGFRRSTEQSRVLVCKALRRVD